MIVAHTTDEELLELILEFANDQPQFDPAYVVQMESELRRKGALTKGQRVALENIVRKWHMVEWQEEQAGFHPHPKLTPNSVASH